MSLEENTAVHLHKDDKASKLGMWLFLLTELTLFGGLFLMYAVYRFTHQAEFHIAAKSLNTFIGTLNTSILLTSSLTMALSITAIRKGNKNLSLSFQGITIFFGLLFLLNKYFEWSHEINIGNFPGSESLLSKSQGEILFYGLYYVMTGLHALHVIIGMIVIAVMMRFTMKNIINRNDNFKLEAAGLYWHLVDIIWIFLFPLFYLIS
ncbi:MAG TPA: cytochrome c oxidase subunit 3 family protein [Ignavibacteria bacterium]|nr:cytochrome c oxidase subunit 3 family protein [Ignavibacteria bacterium]